MLDKICINAMLRANVAKDKMESFLEEQADAGNPVTDSDGKYMQLAPNYEVDYSDYQ